MVLRILASIILLISVLTMPFWFSVILLLGAIIYFSFFVEGVIIFLLIDLLYGAPEEKLFNMIFASFVFALVSFVLLELAKTRLRFDSK